MDRQDREFIEARRNIALGKLTAFDDECWRLAGLARAGIVTVAAAVDALAEADVANALSATFGADLLRDMMRSAFEDAAFRPICAEVA